MWITKRKWQELEKKVADLEKSKISHRKSLMPYCVSNRSKCSKAVTLRHLQLRKEGDKRDKGSQHHGSDLPGERGGCGR